jgi:asparagine synthase (glutamine-hydrolysing)
MCGIAGILSSTTSNKLVEAMLHQMHHRGPDGSGAWNTNIADRRALTLGHARLSILDLSDRGAQPMLDATGNYAITFNGEIYNYLEVRGELKKLGAAFHSSSDTEVLLEAYKHWGSACLDRLNGMFAFAIYDRQRQTLFCARDRYGEKPFLFSFAGDGFSFASEYKAILLNPALSLDYDERRLISAAYNPSTGLDGERQTLFNDVQQLLPGQAMEVSVNNLQHRIWQYWEVRPSELREDALEDDVFAEYRELLTDSVRIRMRSDVPVGSCLSGGLDSSAIVGIARQLLGDDVQYHTFTGRFPGTAADEWEYASLVVDKNRVESHIVEPTVDRFLDELPTFMWHNELPVGSSSQFAQWCVFKLANEHGVTVLLDGQGADEGLGGYEQYFAKYVKALMLRGDQVRLAKELPQIKSRYPLALTPPGRALRDKLPFRLRHWLSGQFGVGTNLLYGLNPVVAEQISVQAALSELAGFNPLSNALVQDSFGRFLTVLLRYGDRNSMAHSREVRLPFCDHRLAEFVFSLPPHLLMGEVQTKRLLRESMRGILPEEVRTRWNKQGFRPPQDQWFQSERMQACVKDTFSSTSFRQSAYWNAPWWENLMDRVDGGQSSLGWTAWQPFVIEQWKAHFLEPLQAARLADFSKQF